MTRLRPYGVVLEGRLELGLELVREPHGWTLRPHTGVPRPFVVSAPFVNAHSHLEYRGLQDTIAESAYWPWIRELTRLKAEQSEGEVREDCLLAARENRATGVGWVAEHSDRPHAGEAMAACGLRGYVFQELITFFEREDPSARIRFAEERAAANRSFGLPATVNPHAAYTVDAATLATFAGRRISIHVAETGLEDEFFRDGRGTIADFYRAHGFPVDAPGVGVVEWLDRIGLAGPEAQFVHACAVSEADVELISRRDVAVAHCPRSNGRLGCPAAPVRRMLAAGVRVGLGMDSPASGGPVDMFAEMRAALAVAGGRGEPLEAEEVWRMAVEAGASAVGVVDWGFEQGVIAVHVDGARTTGEVIERGRPEAVEWLW